MKQLIPFFLLAVMAVACNNHDKMSKDLIGEWHGVSWTANGAPVMPDATVLTMVLSKDGVYNLISDGRTENGDWKVKNDTLFLSPEKTEDVKMKIVSLTTDNLKLQVARGQVEDVEFKR